MIRSLVNAIATRALSGVNRRLRQLEASVALVEAEVAVAIARRKVGR